MVVVVTISFTHTCDDNVSSHSSSQLQSLCSMKISREILQKLSYVWNKNLQYFFPILSYTLDLLKGDAHYLMLVKDHGIHWINLERKNYVFRFFLFQRHFKAFLLTFFYVEHKFWNCEECSNRCRFLFSPHKTPLIQSWWWCFFFFFILSFSVCIRFIFAKPKNSSVYQELFLLF